MIYDTRLQLSRFLLFNDRWATDLEIALIFSTVVSPSLSSAFPLSLYRFLAPVHFLLWAFLQLSPFTLLCPSLSVTLWIFASLLHNGTPGTRALQSILQTALLQRTCSKCHVTTWENDICGGDRLPQSTYYYQQKGDGYDWEEESAPGTLMREIRDHWRGEEISKIARTTGR